MNRTSTFTYSYRFGSEQVFNILIGTGLLGFALYLLYRFELDNTLMILIGVFSLIGVIPILLSINYISTSIGLQIHFDEEKGIVAVTNNRRTETFKLENITSVEICEHISMGLYWFEFDYARYTFEDGKFCIIPNFMTDEYFIPAGIEPRIYKKVFPVIWKRTNI